MKKYLSVLGLCFLFAVNLFAAGNKEAPQDPSKPVSLRFTTWSANAAHLEMLKGFADEYKKIKPNVSVTFETLANNEYTSLLTLQLAGSNPPDGGWILEGTGPTFVNSGVLADLKPYLSSISDYDYNDFSTESLSLWVKGNSTYAIPFSTSPFVIFYNKDLFAKAGAPTPADLLKQGKYTWENFAESLKLIKSKTGIYGLQGQNGEAYAARIWHTLVPFLRAYGADAWNDQGPTLDSPAAIQAITLYHRMIFQDKSIVPPGDRSDFFAGAAATTVNQISRVPAAKQGGFAWDIAPLPGGPAGPTYVIGQAALGVFNSSKNKQEAIEFLAFMTNKANVTTMARFFPPARKSVIAAGAIAKQNPDISAESIKYVEEGAAKGKVLPAHVNFPQIDLTARGEFDKLWKPDANIPEVMKTINQNLKRFF